MSKTMANPEGAKAGEPYQNFDGGGFHRNQLCPLPKIGEGFREWSEASSYGKKRLEMLRWLQAKPATGSGGIPQREICLAVCPCQWYSPARSKASLCVKRLCLIEECKASLQKNS